MSLNGLKDKQNQSDYKMINKFLQNVLYPCLKVFSLLVMRWPSGTVPCKLLTANTMVSEGFYLP